MEDVELDIYLYERLNLAFSVNYMVLENLRHIDPANQDGIISNKNLFGPKSYTQKHYDGLYKDYAEIRNFTFDKIQKDFDEKQFEHLFILNSDYFLGLYNAVSQTPIAYSDLFSATDIKDFKLFAKIEEDIVEDRLRGSMKSLAAFVVAYQGYKEFYAAYKIWLSVSDIFETLKSDINPCGGKSFYFQRPQNKNIFFLDKSTSDEFFTPIMKVISKHSAKLKKYNLTDVNPADPVLCTDKHLASIMNLIIATNIVTSTKNIINRRFECANKKPSNPKNIISNFIDTFIDSFVLQETKFTVDKIYIHKIEILNLLNSLSLFPELSEQVKFLQSLLLGDERDFGIAYNKHKENA